MKSTPTRSSRFAIAEPPAPGFAGERAAAYAATLQVFSGAMRTLLDDRDPMAQIAAVRAGVPLADAMQVQAALQMSKRRFYDILGFPEATMKRKERGNERLSPEQTERVLGVARLIATVQRMVAESGEARGFDAAAWVAQWLEQAVPALGGLAPATLMDTVSGQKLVMDVLARMQSGAYA